MSDKFPPDPCPCFEAEPDTSPCYISNSQPDAQVCICFDLGYGAKFGQSMFG